jgi:hypothetical protein
MPDFGIRGYVESLHYARFGCQVILNITIDIDVINEYIPDGRLPMIDISIFKNTIFSLTIRHGAVKVETADAGGVWACRAASGADDFSARRG